MLERIILDLSKGLAAYRCVTNGLLAKVLKRATEPSESRRLSRGSCRHHLL